MCLKKSLDEISPTKEIRRLKSALRKSVSDYRLKPVAWVYRLFACFFNAQRTTQNTQHIIHAIGFNQWLMADRTYAVGVIFVGADDSLPENILCKVLKPSLRAA